MGTLATTTNQQKRKVNTKIPLMYIPLTLIDGHSADIFGHNAINVCRNICQVRVVTLVMYKFAKIMPESLTNQYYLYSTYSLTFIVSINIILRQTVCGYVHQKLYEYVQLHHRILYEHDDSMRAMRHWFMHGYIHRIRTPPIHTCQLYIRC